MVAECRGTHPTRSGTQCFGANNGGVAGSFSAVRADEHRLRAPPRGTAPAGRHPAPDRAGEPVPRLRHPAAVLAGRGAGPGRQRLRLARRTAATTAQDTGQPTSAPSRSAARPARARGGTGSSCRCTSRPRRPTARCANASFSVIGSPMLTRAMSQWQAALCTGADPLSIQYDSAQSEPLARLDFLSGSDDVALTTRPASWSPASIPTPMRRSRSRRCRSPTGSTTRSPASR